MLPLLQHANRHSKACRPGQPGRSTKHLRRRAVRPYSKKVPLQVVLVCSDLEIGLRRFFLIFGFLISRRGRCCLGQYERALVTTARDYQNTQYHYYRNQTYHLDGSRQSGPHSLPPLYRPLPLETGMAEVFGRRTRSGTDEFHVMHDQVRLQPLQTE